MGLWQKRLLVSHLEKCPRKVDEKQQLRNAANHYKKNKENP